MNLLNETILKQLGSSTLRSRGITNFAANAEMVKEARSFTPAKVYDVFLSYRTSDAEIVWGLKTVIEREGLSVYVYWAEDPTSLLKPVTKQTADDLRSKMRASRSLLYAASPAASESKWMPWELGYVDGFRRRVAILPIASGSTETSEYQGQEYLGIYPWIRRASTTNRLSVIDGKTHISFLKEWIN